MALADDGWLEQLVEVGKSGGKEVRLEVASARTSTASSR
jgi:hypothetical protein